MTAARPRRTIAAGGASQMTIVLSVVLFIVGIVFAMNMLGSLAGRYWPTRTWGNALLAGSIAAAAFAGGYIHIA